MHGTTSSPLIDTLGSFIQQPRKYSVGMNLFERQYNSRERGAPDEVIIFFLLTRLRRIDSPPPVPTCLLFSPLFLTSSTAPCGVLTHKTCPRRHTTPHSGSNVGFFSYLWRVSSFPTHFGREINLN